MPNILSCQVFFHFNKISCLLPLFWCNMFSIGGGNMNIEKTEVLRYLGYNNQNIDENTNQLLHECMTEILDIMKKNYVYDIYDIFRDENRIFLKNTTLTTQSKDLCHHLQKSDKCVIMAASLGLEVDQRIAYYSKTHMTKSIVLDACASTAIEALCDHIEEEISKKAEKEGYYMTPRYSPGYGDLPMTLQKEIAKVLKTYSKIGLTVNESNLLLPRKSVTAFIGWQKEKTDDPVDKCSTCQKENCSYRNLGRFCK